MKQLSLFEEQIGDLIVDNVSYDECLPFIMGIHYARRIPCIQYAFGLFLNYDLIGVVTFGQPASPSLCEGVGGKKYKNRVLELNRLVIKPEYNGKNYASILVSKALKRLPKGYYIVSYADWEGWGHIGYVYQATNFLYTGKTESRTDKYSEGHSRHYAQDEERRQYRTSKHRYIYITGDKKQKKELLSALKYKIVAQYPKGDNTNYDTDNPKPLVGKTTENPKN